MSWLIITLVAYFLNAVAMVIDKTLLKKEIQNPFVYTFYIAALGGFLVLLALPLAYLFSLQLIWPGWTQFWLSMLAGGTFSIGLFLMFFALKKEDTSRLIPMIGGLVPVFVLILAYFFIGEQLITNQFYAFILILIGTFLIALDFGTKDNVKISKVIWLALPSALFFGISYVLTKDVYNHQPFISGFVWTRIGAFVLMLLPLFYSKNRNDLLHPKKDKTTKQLKKTTGKFLLGQTCGGVSAIMIQYAISIASVSLVQALQGTQYVFVFIMVLITTFYFPKFLREYITRQIVIQKFIAILLISIGIYFII